MEFKKEPKKESKSVSIIPLKDHIICHNEFYYDLKEGVEIEIDKKFLEVLLSEKVILTKG
jgi:hypothetical protein